MGLKNYRQFTLYGSILLIIGFIGWAILIELPYSYDNIKGDQSMIHNLRISYPYFKSINEFNPHNVQTTADAGLARNLFGRLIGYDDDGNIEGNLASEIVIDKGVLALTVRDVVTIDGHQVGAADALNTLEIIVTKDTSTHGSLRTLLGMTPEDKVSDFIYSTDKIVYIKPVSAHNIEFIVPLLASTDFSIIPKNNFSSVNEVSKIDFRNTSGIYYVKEDSADGHILLAANPGHFLYSETIPTLIQLVPSYAKEARKLFEEGNVDFITTVTGSGTGDYRVIPEIVKGASISETFGIELISLRTTEAAHQRHSPDELLFIGEHIKKAYLEHDKHYPYFEKTDQIFPALGEGILPEEMVNTLNNRKAAILKSEIIPRNPFMLAVGMKQVEQFSTYYKHLEYVQVVGISQAPWTLPLSEQPDGYIIGSDSSFFESLSLLSYNFSAGSFGSPQEGSDWLKQYTSEPSREDRIKLLRKLHLDILSKGYVVPIYFTKYVAIIGKGYKFNVSKFFAGTKWWKIQKN